MRHLTDQQLRKLRQTLEEEKNELREHFEINGTTRDTLSADSGGELSSYDNHPADMATEVYEAGRDQAIDENLDQKLGEAEAALERMDQGTYGKCELCREPIPYERLEALPWAATCLEHAGLTDGAARSTERYEMTAPVMPDDADTWKTLNDYGSTDVDPPEQPGRGEA